MIPGSGRSPGGGLATYSSILAGKSHGQRSLAGYSPWGRKESNTTEVTEHECTASAQALKVAISLSKLLLQLHQKQNKKTLNKYLVFVQTSQS